MDEINAEAIEKAIDEHYQKTEPNGLPIRPSAFGGCPRRVAHLIAGVEPNSNTPSLERLFELGHQRGEALHEAVRSQMMSKGWGVYAEFEVWVPLPIVGDAADEVLRRMKLKWPLDGRYPMHVQPSLVTTGERRLCVTGHIDTLISGAIPGVNVIIDYKTCSSFGFGMLNTEGAKVDNITQLLAYDAGLAWGTGKGATSLFLVYEAKDSDARKGHSGNDIRVIEVEKNSENLARYESAVAGMANALLDGLEGRAGVVPEPYPIGGKSGRSKKLPWQCDYCSVGPMATLCYGGELVNKGALEKPKWYLSDNQEELQQERIEHDFDNADAN